MVKILVSGYLGFGNSGDESILYAMKTNIPKLVNDVKITALSKDPEFTKKHFNINAIHAFHLLKVIKAIKDTDILISGGGSLLQDGTSMRSLLYYISIILIGKLYSKKIILYANGVGPLKRDISKKIVKLVLEKVDIITLRESMSYNLLNQLNIRNKNIYVTADPVFTLKSITKEVALQYIRQEQIPMDKPLVGVAFRKWSHSEKYTKLMAKLCDELIEEKGVNILFIPMQNPSDKIFSRYIMNMMKNPSYILNNEYEATELMGIIGQTYMVLGMRLHALIFSGIKKIPMVGFDYDPKVEYYLKTMDMESAGKIETLDINIVREKIHKVMDNYSLYKDRLNKVIPNLENKAALNDYYLSDLIKNLKI